MFFTKFAVCFDLLKTFENQYAGQKKKCQINSFYQESQFESKQTHFREINSGFVDSGLDV